MRGKNYDPQLGVQEIAYSAIISTPNSNKKYRYSFAFAKRGREELRAMGCRSIDALLGPIRPASN
jgi:hypothetical protein